MKKGYFEAGFRLPTRQKAGERSDVKATEAQSLSKMSCDILVTSKVDYPKKPAESPFSIHELCPSFAVIVCLTLRRKSGSKIWCSLPITVMFFEQKLLMTQMHLLSLVFLTNLLVR